MTICIDTYYIQKRLKRRTDEVKINEGICMIPDTH